MFCNGLRDNGFPLAVFAVLRLWTMVWASLVAATVPLSAQAGNFYYGVAPLNDLIFAPWQRWDTIWYTKIALEGYAADASSHFPLFYPFLIRLVLPVTGNNAVAAGLLVSSIAALVSFVLLYQLAREMFEESAARRTILFLAVFPTAFFLFAAYTEAVFLALALGAFVCARGKHWVWAGIFGACAAMTRAQGMLFVLPLAVEFWMQYRRGQVPLNRAWSLIFVVLGGGAQIALLALQFGSLDAWFRSEAILHRPALPWESLAAGWGAVLQSSNLFEAGLSLLDPLSILLLLGAIGWSARKLPLSMTVYVALVLLPSLFVVTTYSDAYPLTSVSRFVVLAFPLFLLLGSLPARWWQPLVYAVSFLLQTLLLVLFAAWVFVR